MAVAKDVVALVYDGGEDIGKTADVLDVEWTADAVHSGAESRCSVAFGCADVKR